MSGRHYDVLIVGAGSMGMSAGYYLAREGVRTLLIDAFDPPHESGSHHGEPRLIRHAYTGGPVYIELALAADRLWQELEAAAEEKLLERSGVLNMADPALRAFDRRIADAEAAGVMIEHLSAAEVGRRWPGIRLPDDYEGMYEPDAGYLYSERCVAAYKRLALAEGAELLSHTPVIRLEATGAGVAAHTHQGAYYADRLIVTAGAWFPALEPFVSLPIRPVRKTVGWFASREPLFEAGQFPGFTLASELGGFYGFPSIAGAGVKIGRHDGGLPWEPGQEVKPFGSQPEDEGDLRRALDAYMPLAAGKLNRGAVCKYELTPDRDFIIDRHPAYPHVWLAGGFSGHGFKFASVVGRLLADWIVRDDPGFDVRMFSASRFAAIRNG
ncbi:methyltryptophan oxidase [Paenibacillus sp. 32O-W]|uniref:N-methyl-L-tryptophan oxidase n=1 Tax=Paenibacillus sp. 32O-W TaxID=1695218 RepID=UPI00071F3BA6|nr:N-methyl-L-tryptophan oxidase [Paenibacillus sp. 32O-W]ALS26000.1 methyltryptophan oxidase [Paenibacillus sp. 32O-W]